MRPETQDKITKKHENKTYLDHREGEFFNGELKQRLNKVCTDLHCHDFLFTSIVTDDGLTNHLLFNILCTGMMMEEETRNIFHTRRIFGSVR